MKNELTYETLEMETLVETETIEDWTEEGTETCEGKGGRSEEKKGNWCVLLKCELSPSVSRI